MLEIMSSHTKYKRSKITFYLYIISFVFIEICVSILLLAESRCIDIFARCVSCAQLALVMLALKSAWATSGLAAKASEQLVKREQRPQRVRHPPPPHAITAVMQIQQRANQL